MTRIVEVAEGEMVGRTLNDYLQRSERANSRAVLEARAVFDQAYALARQVVELREKHQLTQVELSEKTGIPGPDQPDRARGDQPDERHAGQGRRGARRRSASLSIELRAQILGF